MVLWICAYLGIIAVFGLYIHIMCWTINKYPWSLTVPFKISVRHVCSWRSRCWGTQPEKKATYEWSRYPNSYTAHAVVNVNNAIRIQVNSSLLLPFFRSYSKLDRKHKRRQNKKINLYIWGSKKTSKSFPQNGRYKKIFLVCVSVCACVCLVCVCVYVCVCVWFVCVSVCVFGVCVCGVCVCVCVCGVCLVCVYVCVFGVCVCVCVCVCVWCVCMCMCVCFL